MEGLNCAFKIHEEDTIKKPWDPGFIYFNDFMIIMKIMEGLQDPFIKQKVITLFQKDPRCRLEKHIEKVITWETAKKAAEITGIESYANGAHSGFRPPKQGKTKEFCMNCGDKSHPVGNTEAIRKTKCKAYGKSCGRCKQQHHFTSTCKVTPEKLTEVLARNGQKYQLPGKEGKAPFKGGKCGEKVNAKEQETIVKEMTPMETELRAGLATVQARLDSFPSIF